MIVSEFNMLVPSMRRKKTYSNIAQCIRLHSLSASVTNYQLRRTGACVPQVAVLIKYRRRPKENAPNSHWLPHPARAKVREQTRKTIMSSDPVRTDLSPSIKDRAAEAQAVPLLTCLPDSKEFRLTFADTFFRLLDLLLEQVSSHEPESTTRDCP